MYLQACEKLLHSVSDLIFRNWLPEADAVLQVTLGKPKNEVDLVLAKGDHLLERGDVGVSLEVAQNLDLHQQLCRLSSVHLVGVDNALHRDALPSRGVVRAVDSAEGARAYRPEPAVAAVCYVSALS